MIRRRAATLVGFALAAVLGLQAGGVLRAMHVYLEHGGHADEHHCRVCAEMALGVNKYIVEEGDPVVWLVEVFAGADCLGEELAAGDAWGMVEARGPPAVG